MMKSTTSKALQYAIVALMSLTLSGCIGEVWTGASLIYDRHHVYLKVNDFQLAASISRSLYRDKEFKRPDCSIEIAVFNLDVLMVGHVPTQALRDEAAARIRVIPGIRRFFNQLELSSTSENPLLDSWITTAIRSQILSNSDIDPEHFKVVTSNQIVYLMGQGMPLQGKAVIEYARRTEGVKRVVTLLKYYHLSDKPE